MDKEKFTPEAVTEHVRTGGPACFICGETSITGGFAEIEAGVMSQEITCPDCGADYYEYYEMVGLRPAEEDDVIFEQTMKLNKEELQTVAVVLSQLPTAEPDSSRGRLAAKLRKMAF